MASRAPRQRDDVRIELDAGVPLQRAQLPHVQGRRASAPANARYGARMRALTGSADPAGSLASTPFWASPKSLTTPSPGAHREQALRGVVRYARRPARRAGVRAAHAHVSRPAPRLGGSAVSRCATLRLNADRIAAKAARRRRPTRPAPPAGPAAAPAAPSLPIVPSFPLFPSSPSSPPSLGSPLSPAPPAPTRFSARAELFVRAGGRARQPARRSFSLR